MGIFRFWLIGGKYIILINKLHLFCQANNVEKEKKLSILKRIIFHKKVALNVL